MQQLAWLSPLIEVDYRTPFLMTTSRSPGKIAKNIIALPLETCMPGYAECSNDPVLNEAFLANALNVLKKNRTDLQFLKEEPLPSVLEPVRSYLVLTFQSSLDWKDAEYAYLHDSNLGPAREQLCKQCGCSTQEQLLQAMANEKEPDSRLKLALYDFENTLVNCFAAHDPGYPMQAWKDFLKQYKVKEVWNAKWVP